MREIGHFVGGKQVKGGSGRTGDVFNPNTGEVQAKVAFASKSEMQAAIVALRKLGHKASLKAQLEALQRDPARSVSRYAEHVLLQIAS